MNRTDYMNLRDTLIRDGWMQRSDAHGWLVAGIECSQLLVTLLLLASVQPFGVVYWLLQGWLAVSMFRAFVLVHECGHGTLFESKKLNRIFGRIFGVISQIPADNWRIVHFQHHIWVGVVDKDPTSVGILDVKKYSPMMRKIYNVLWKLRLPLAAIGGVFKAFWMFPLVQAKAGNRKNARIGWISNAITLAPWVMAFVVFGWETVLSTVGPALVLFYVWFECINLTHHAGLYKHISSSHPKAIPLYEQAEYCRTARLPTWFSLITCYHFNLHTEHHLFPTVPWHRAPALKRLMDTNPLENYIEVDFLGHMKSIREADPFVLFIDSAPSR